MARQRHIKKIVQQNKQPQLPTSHQHRPIKRNENASANNQYYEHQDFDSVWLSEFLSYEKTRNESIAKADLLNFTKLPGSTVHPHAEKHLLQQSKCVRTQSCKKSSMSADERRRLNELSRQLNGKKKTTSKTTSKDGNPYLEANTKISRVLQHVTLQTNKEDMEASQLNEYYMLVVRETQAAIKIQCQCRRVLATRQARQFAREVSGATQIQTRARMLIARRLLEKLRYKKRRATEIRERLVRLFIARYQRRKLVEFENRAATLSQSTVRMYFAKCVMSQKRLQRSWEVNQKRWMALSIRLAWKDLRINFYARQIQCIVRKRLAKSRVERIFCLFSRSAVAIQCAWRRLAARIRTKDVVYRATVDKMCNKIRLIASEKEYWRLQVEKLSKPNKTERLSDLEAQKEKLKTELAEKRDQIQTLESHYKDQLEIQDQISPRSIASGWEQQIKLNLKDTRERITAAKLDLLFRIQINLNKVDRELEQLQLEQRDSKQSLDHWSNWHRVEQDRLWDFQRQHNREVEGKELRHAIVDQTLKWAVKHRVQSGKPDKRKPLVNGPVDNEVVENLIDGIKSKADEFQALQHAEHTFKPFQNFWDSLSATISDLGDLPHPANNVANKSLVIQPAPVASTPVASTPVDEIDLKDASLYPQKKAFQAKLPFHLLEEMRKERIDIATSLKPK